jgi:hypothetical protein
MYSVYPYPMSVSLDQNGVPIGADEQSTGRYENGVWYPNRKSDEVEKCFFRAVSKIRFRSLTSRAKNLERMSISQTIMEVMDLQPSTVHTLILVITPTVDMFQRRTLLMAVSICHRNTLPNIEK